MKDPSDLTKLKQMLTKVNILLESFRPGVMERLGLSPAEVHALNPNLIYVRLSAYGQHASIAKLANHDMNFLALNGVLNRCKPQNSDLKESENQHGAKFSDPYKPVIPFNIIGDYVGGSLATFTLILQAVLSKG